MESNPVTKSLSSIISFTFINIVDYSESLGGISADSSGSRKRSGPQTGSGNFSYKLSHEDLFMPKQKGTTGKFHFDEDAFLLTFKTSQLTNHTCCSIRMELACPPDV